jgi:hypothetical protein
MVEQRRRFAAFKRPGGAAVECGHRPAAEIAYVIVQRDVLVGESGSLRRSERVHHRTEKGCKSVCGSSRLRGCVVRFSIDVLLTLV